MRDVIGIKSLFITSLVILSFILGCSLYVLRINDSITSYEKDTQIFRDKVIKELKTHNSQLKDLEPLLILKTKKWHR